MVLKFDFTKNPMDMHEFLKKHGKQLKGKDILYAVKTNHKSDRDNVKVGKAEDGEQRFKGYQNILGEKSATDPNAGMQMLYAEIVPKRKVGLQGKKLVELKENKLKADLRKASKSGRAVTGGVARCSMCRIALW